MVTLDRIRNDVEKVLETERDLKYVDVRADTIEEALADAAVQLDSKVSYLEYEVLEKGSEGFLGFVKKPWYLRIYENVEVTAEKARKRSLEKTSIIDDDIGEAPKIVDADGLFYIHYFESQICLKVTLPVGNGTPVDVKEIIARTKRTDTISIEENLIYKYAKEGTNGVYEPIGQYQHNPAGDSMISVDVSNDEMHAMITVTSPAIGGQEVSAEHIKRMLGIQGIVIGIDDKKINDYVDNPVYGVPYVVADGIVPCDGRDAYIAYNFETDRSKIKLQEAQNGQVNFKELNLFQNVIEGQPLAQKILPEHGKAGKTVYGKYLEAKNGKDINLPVGKNVKVDTDGRTMIAECSGHVLLVGDKVTVEPFLMLDKGVNIKTGNINFMGTVIVRGNVDDGFNIKASGNIEISGTVGSCNLEAEGDIIVSLGIHGRDAGFVKAGKSIWAKFIQSTTVEAEEFVIVSDSIVNSNVSSNRKIIVNGKRAAIIGGHLFATEEIHAKNIGTHSGGTETVLEVGFDPRARKRLEEIIAQRDNLARELDDVERNIATLENQKKVRRMLPHEKEESLIKFTQRKDEILEENITITKEIEELQQHLRELKVIGKISASDTIYAGVKVYVRDAYDEFATDVKAVTVYWKAGFVYKGKYEPPSSDDVTRVPEGYSAG
jgi:uncharacterized protein (DUF342 family)